MPSKSGVGMFAFNQHGYNGNEYFKSCRMAIIGPSGSGKTTLAFHLVLDLPKPLEAVVYCAPPTSLENECPIKFGKFCEKAKMGFVNVPVSGDGALEIPMFDNPSLVMFDDLYKVKKAGPLITELFIRGRHDKRHVFYLTQSPTYLPTEINDNKTHLVIHKDFFNRPDVEEKLRLPTGSLVYEGINVPDWIIIKTGEPARPYEFKKFANSSHVIALLSKMVPKKDAKIKDKFKDKDEREIGIYNAGNKRAVSTPKTGSAVIGGDVREQTAEDVLLCFRP